MRTRAKSRAEKPEEKSKAVEVSPEKNKKEELKKVPKTKKIQKKTVVTEPEPEPEVKPSTEDKEDVIAEISKAAIKGRKVRNQYQLARMKRAKTQRMYLITVTQASETVWTFSVLGASGSTYALRISQDFGLSCTCPDFYRQRRPCKHLYFIVAQVAQFDELLEKMPNTLNISNNNYNLLNTMLKHRLKSRLKLADTKTDDSKEDEDKKVDLGDDTDCAICFEELEASDKTLDNCGQCKKYFHGECLRQWKMRTSTCPLCRYIFPNPTALNSISVDPRAAGLSSTDPLAMLRQANLSLS